MSERKFKFISPGVFINEIDKSQLDATARARGPLVVGRSERGPAMRPTTVQSFNEFVQLFGNPIPGGRAGDIWRTGNYSAPTYASYAAQGYLRNNNPVTFVRLLGIKHSTATTDAGTPGWKFTNYDTTGGGAQGLFLVDSGSNAAMDDGEALSGTLAAIFYFSSVTNGLKLTGVPLGGTVSETSAGTLIASTGDNFEFKGQFYGGSLTDTVTFNFNKSSDKFIRKAFNTNPTLVNTNTNATANQELYFLGESFEGLIGGILNSSSEGNVMGVMLPLKTPPIAQINTYGSDFKRDSSYGKSGWIIPQDSGPTGSFDTRAPDLTKLFRLESLDRGEWTSRNVKGAIRDIKFSNNEYDDYGTFTLILRSTSDTDAEPVVLERFENLNLNLESPNYIARVIGDKYVDWDENTNALREYGQYDNRSRLVRVEVGPAIEDGGAAGLLPAGFIGPPTFNTFRVRSGSANPLLSDFSTTFPDTFVTGGLGVNGGSAVNFVDAGDSFPLSASIAFPKIKLRTTSNDPILARETESYFGLDTRRNNPPSGRLFDECYYDLVRNKPASVDNFVSSSIAAQSLVFSLDDLSASVPTNSTDYRIYMGYATGNRRLGKSLTAAGISGSYKGASAETGSFQLLLDFGYDKFTFPIVGGFDGFDVTEREPLRNSMINSTTPGEDYVYNTYQMGVDFAAEQNGLDINLAVVPGLTNTTLTERLITNCEERGDVLAVIDLENDYVPRYERTTAGSLSDADNIGDVDSAVTALNNRNLNSSYGCVYYPWVLIRDTVSTGQNLWVPPSVVALGVMGNSETSGELWFAPAGFTRGGLSEGMSGLSVIGVRQKLSSKNRDKLYEQNINPIASFPAEGIVVFGQKTLQLTRSAMDRINVRRLLIFLKKEISFAASRILFDQNIPATWARFVGRVQPLLENVQTRFGLTDFKLVLDETTTTTELVDRNIMYAKIFLKPTRAIEYIALDFIITATGASFEE